MFPLVRNQVEYTTKNISFLLDNISLPPFQRSKNELHVQLLYQYMKKYFEINHDIICTGLISFAMLKNEQEQDELWLLDGQHRVRALQQLAKERPEILTILIRTDIYKVNSKEEMEQLYRIINETKKVDMFRSSTSLKVWPRIEEWFQLHFSSYWKDTKQPNMLNVSREEVKKRMEAEGWLEQPVETVINALETLRTHFTSISDESWTKWGIIKDAKKNKLIEKDGFYFGLFRRYEWISRLGTPYVEHYSIDKQRHSIPKRIRNEVWNKRFAENMTGECFCCKKTLSFQNGFHCGHILSYHEGGTDTVSNLEVVCEVCNLDMSTMNMNVYKTHFCE
jgi:hypothetical protein